MINTHSCYPKIPIAKKIGLEEKDIEIVKEAA